MSARPLDPAVYLVTDTGRCGGPDGVARTVEAAVGHGVTAVQLRDPAASTRALATLARTLLAGLRDTGVPLVVNDRLDVALAVGADGVHLGQRDLDPVSARRLAGPDLHIGLSVSTVGEATDALALPAGTVDLLGVGPVLATSSKPDAAPPGGWETLRSICALSPLPCVAIGGLGAGHAEDVRRAGAAGMAVVSEICGRPDVAAAAAGLSLAWHAAAAGGTGAVR